MGYVLRKREQKDPVRLLLGLAALVLRGWLRCPSHHADLTVLRKPGPVRARFFGGGEGS